MSEIVTFRQIVEKRDKRERKQSWFCLQQQQLSQCWRLVCPHDFLGSLQRLSALKTKFINCFFAVKTASFSNAQLATWSNPSDNDFSVKLNIPESGNDIFLQLNGPTSAGWVGTGIGTQMRGALIFVIYQDGDGNVTASSRLGV